MKKMTMNEMMYVNGGQLPESGRSYTFFQKVENKRREFQGKMDTIGHSLNIKPVTDTIVETVNFFSNF